MRLNEIVAGNEFAAYMYDIKIDLHKRFDEATNLFNEIMHRKIPNYACINISYFLKVKEYVDKFLSNTDIYPDQNDSDLISLTADAKQMITEIDNMLSAMKDAKLIK